MGDPVPCLSHAGLTILVLLAGIQDWRRREVSDWLTWPLFLFGLASAIADLLQHLDFLALAVSIFLIVAWYFGWMGGADARILSGLWGLWPLGGFMALMAVGLWGSVLVLRQRGKERIPALVGSGFAVAILLIIELVR